MRTTQKRLQQFFVPILILALALLTGCIRSEKPPTAAQSGKVKLYYGSPGNESMVTETREINYSNDMEKYKATLRALFSGPKNPSLVANIPKGTNFHGIILQGTSLIVDLNSNFSRFPGSIAEIIAVGSIVNSLTQFPEIDSVKLLVEGEEYIGLSGMPRGFMKTFEDNTKPKMTARKITLYFGDKDAMYVHPETRTIQVTQDISEASLIEVILTELIEGPKSGTLTRTIPEEVNVNSVEIEGDVVHVDFSEEMETKHWGGAAGEAMTINSIVDTLTELPEVKQVKMTVVGHPMAIEHAVLTDPVSRNTSIIRP